MTSPGAPPPASVATVLLASGQGSNAAALLSARARALEAGGSSPWHPVALLTDREGARALEVAEAHGIPGVHVPPGPDHEARLLEALEGVGTELLVLAGYLRLVPAAVVVHYRGRMLNVHPSLLPAFGGPGMYGRRVHEAVLAAGVRVTGVTVHLVDEHFDEGPIVAQWPVPVHADDTAEALAARVLRVEHALYPLAVEHLARSIARSTSGAGSASGARLTPGTRLPSGAIERTGELPPDDPAPLDSGPLDLASPELQRGRLAAGLAFP